MIYPAKKKEVTMNYKVYQIPYPEEGDNEAMQVYRRYAFEPLNRIDHVKISNYRCVYEGKIAKSTTIVRTLDNIYTILNIRHPEDYHARSLSKSDLVRIGRDYYYCDSIGWQKVEVQQ